MRINNISNTGFSGVIKPFSDSRGVYIIPINSVPSSRQIREAVKITADGKQLPMEGYNGRAYYLGKDLVVKKYKGKEEALNDDPMREIKILDKMYEHDMAFKNSQNGCYAFKTPDGEYYLVSTKVKGESPQIGITPFTKENLQSIVDIAAQMDMGAAINGSSKNGFSDRCRFMNYDFNGKNIKVTSKSAGLFDFEYAGIENIDDELYKIMKSKQISASCHQSDTSRLASNLRTFECFTLYEYLMRTDNPDEIFDDYLKIKSNYHNSMANFYNKFVKESAFPDFARLISQKEAAHSRLLAGDNTGKIPFDIKKAEAIKIQMSVFIHNQSSFCETGEVNPAQLYRFAHNGINYFKDELQKAKHAGDKDRQIYFKDCLQLFCDWRQVNKTIEAKIEQNNPKIIRKLTNDYIPMLTDILKV